MRLDWKISSGLIMVSCVIACTVTPIQNPEVNDPATPFEGVCFGTDILPLMVSSCAQSGCHNSTDRADGIDLTSYEGILEEVKPGDPNDSELVEYMKEVGEDAMPPEPADPVSPEKIALVEKWILDGAKNTVDCEPTECDLTGDISLSIKILPIIDTYCLGCHNTNDPQGGYSYTTYDETMKSVNDGTLVGSINFDTGFEAMPDNGIKMPDCNIRLIEEWIAQGAKDN